MLGKKLQCYDDSIYTIDQDDVNEIVENNDCIMESSSVEDNGEYYREILLETYNDDIDDYEQVLHRVEFTLIEGGKNE